MTLLKQLIQIEWMRKHAMAIPLFHEGLSPAFDLIPRPSLHYFFMNVM